MKREDFIRKCLLAGLAGPAIISLMEGCSSVYYATADIKETLITVKKTEFTEIKKDKTRQRAFVLINPEHIYPICVYRLGENEYSALKIICTHQGCVLNPNDYTLVCPCHGSEFSNTGKVLQSPAEEDLEQFQVTSDNENIYVHLTPYK